MALLRQSYCMTGSTAQGLDPALSHGEAVGFVDQFARQSIAAGRDPNTHVENRNKRNGQAIGIFFCKIDQQAADPVISAYSLKNNTN